MWSPFSPFEMERACQVRVFSTRARLKLGPNVAQIMIDIMRCDVDISRWSLSRIICTLVVWKRVLGVSIKLKEPRRLLTRRLLITATVVGPCMRGLGRGRSCWSLILRRFSPVARVRKGGELRRVRVISWVIKWASSCWRANDSRVLSFFRYDFLTCPKEGIRMSWHIKDRRGLQFCSRRFTFCSFGTHVVSVIWTNSKIELV